MRAMVYRSSGGPEVLAEEKLDVPAPGPGEVLVRMAVSGVNPTDWKSRAGGGSAGPAGDGWQIPNQDGAGRLVGVGDGVAADRVGERVWLWESAYQRPWGTAGEYTVIPADQAVPFEGDYELGAALGVPFLTAHRCLTVGETVLSRLGPGTRDGRTVLVQGGAGAVGNAAIQLARWSGATVIATVSSPEKARLAEAAGSHHVVDYRREDVGRRVRTLAPDGVDVIVEVAAANAVTDVGLLARHGAVALYAGTPDEQVTVPIRPLMALNARWQFVLLYTLPDAAKVAAVADVSAAVAAGAARTGEDAGLPLHRFPLEQAGAAHAAVEGGAVGKVLIIIDEDPPPTVS